MINFVLDGLLVSAISANIKLVQLRFFETLGAFLALGARLEELKLAVHLVLELLQLIEEEFLVFFSNLALTLLRLRFEFTPCHQALLVGISLQVNLFLSSCSDFRCLEFRLGQVNIKLLNLLL